MPRGQEIHLFKVCITILALSLSAESLTESVSEPGVTVKQEPQEDGQAQPPPKTPKTLSSFFCEWGLHLAGLRREEAGGSFSKELSLPMGEKA